MIRVRSMSDSYQCCFDQEGTIVIDTLANKGGTGQGIRPHQLLEAALASCMNISLRMKAAQYGIELKNVETMVRLNRDFAGKSIFEYECNIKDQLAEEVRAKITATAGECAVRTTLTNQIEFHRIGK